MGFTNVPATLSLASGTAVAIAAGSSVGLAAGATVGINGTAQVAGTVSVAPDQSRFWPCVSGESMPPVFSGTSPPTYSASGGQPSVNMVNSSSVATWNALARYAGASTSTPCVITGIFWLQVGYLFGMGNTSSGVCVQITGTSPQLWVAGAQVGAAISGLTSSAWHSFELVLTPTLTRLTIDGDAVNNRRSTPSAPNTLLAFQVAAAGASTPTLSNLFVSYPTVVPA